jgi:hypothetical protein
LLNFHYTGLDVKILTTKIKLIRTLQNKRAIKQLSRLVSICKRSKTVSKKRFDDEINRIKEIEAKDYKIFDELFNNTGTHDLYPYDVSFIEELKDSELYLLYLDFLSHIEMKKKQHTYEKKSKKLEINSNKRKIELLEKRLGNTLITAM